MNLITAAAQLQVGEDEDTLVLPPATKKFKEGHSLLDFCDSDSSSNGSSPSLDAVSFAEKEVGMYRAAEETQDPLNWWKLNEHRFRMLAVLARKVLCLPTTSVPSERLSSAGNIGDHVSSQKMWTVCFCLTIFDMLVYV